MAEIEKNTVEQGIQYAVDVVEGSIIANKYTIQACERFLSDLERAEIREDGLEFKPEQAQKFLDFASLCCHTKGEWSGKPIILEPWQVFISVNLFGFYKYEHRRFLFAYIEVARKNGKSTFAAIVLLYMLILDDEGAEVYTAATARHQARIVFDQAKAIVDRSESLKKIITVFQNNLSCVRKGSKAEPLSKEAKRLDGLNTSCAIMDEMHEMAQEVWDVIETSTGSRRAPLMLGITTAGFNRDSMCYAKRDYVSKILEGMIQNDEFFGLIFSLDEGDDWTDPAVWGKANPNLGKSVKTKMLDNLCKQAREMPSSVTGYLTKHMNVWTTAETRWLNSEKWGECYESYREEDLEGLTAYGGLDLSSTQDITAFVLVFPKPQPDGTHKYYTITRFFLPEDTVFERVRKNKVPYDSWARDGHLILTPGAIVDYDFIVNEVKKLSKKYQIKEIAFDPWNATQTALQLSAEGHTMVSIQQTTRNLSEPMKEIEKWIIGRQFRHNGNPVYTWMSNNICAKRDANDNLFPNKEKSTEKIDGITATITAVRRIVDREHNIASVYEERGLLIL